jgi:hypothetical protein
MFTKQRAARANRGLVFKARSPDDRVADAKAQTFAATFTSSALATLRAAAEALLPAAASYVAAAIEALALEMTREGLGSKAAGLNCTGLLRAPLDPNLMKLGEVHGHIPNHKVEDQFDVSS